MAISNCLYRERLTSINKLNNVYETVCDNNRTDLFVERFVNNKSDFDIVLGPAHILTVQVIIKLTNFPVPVRYR